MYSFVFKHVGIFVYMYVNRVHICMHTHTHAWNNYSSILTLGLLISRCYHLMDLDSRLLIISNTIGYNRTDSSIILNNKRVFELIIIIDII